MITIKLILQGLSLVLIVWQLVSLISIGLSGKRERQSILKGDGRYQWLALASRISVAAMLNWIAMTL